MKYPPILHPRTTVGILLLGAWMLAIWPSTAAATERIQSFHADIRVHPEGQVEVVETIAVIAEGEQIRRGIYRDFPTDYTDRLGNQVLTTFEVLDTRRDGATEARHQERLANGWRVYLGQADVLLPHGAHTYEIHYRSDYQIGFFAHHDEIYWNVTGNGWTLPMEQVTATVHLPGETPAAQLEAQAWQGVMGSTEAARIDAVSTSQVVVSASRPLAAGEGLTLVAVFPKGLVREPALSDQVLRLLRHNTALLGALGGLLVTLVYYLLIWHRVGRDPPKGVIIARYEPVANLSAAAHRFVRDMSYDARCFAAALVSLAIKGHIRLDLEKPVTVTRQSAVPPGPPPSLGERAILDTLLKHGDHFVFQRSAHARIRQAMTAHTLALAKEHQQLAFRTNGRYLAGGVVLSVLTQFLVWPNDPSPLAVVLAIMAPFGLHILFAWLLRAPTVAGRKLMDQIEGFADYLAVAEGEDIARMGGPVMSTSLYERFLPYAFALDLDNRWTARFEREVERSLADPASRSDGSLRSYRPAWTGGSLTSLGGLSQSLGAMISSISAASQAPGSSSGRSGGSSGGGGGGGGGGGW